MFRIDGSWLRENADYFYIGLMLPSCIGVGVAMGWAIDHYFHTDPWGKLGGFLFGVLAGFVNFVRDYQNMQSKKKNESKKHKEARYSSSDNRSGGPDRPTEL
jgi:F0F1-type ATP synthase assembly protein I